jgi:hypothetical protein
MRYNNYDNDKHWETKREKQAKKMGIRFPEKSKGRFRKQHPLDCGRPKCMMCSGHKVVGIKSHKQEIEDLRFKEQL